MRLLRWVSTTFGLIGLLGNLHPSALQGQGGGPNLREFREVHLGMEVRIVLDSSASPSASALARIAFDRIDSLNLHLSDWLAQSELSRVSRLPIGRWHTISPELTDVLARALEVAEATEGRFDPTIGPLTQLWRRERSTGRSPSEAERSEAADRVGWQHLMLDSAGHRIRFDRDGMQLDLGGIAKGYILEQAAREIRARGQHRFLLEAGGDLVLGDAPEGTEGWRVRVRRDRGDTVIVASNQAISTSGPSAQSLPTAGGGIASHVIDITTGKGSGSRLEVTVMGRDATLTDALSTALTLMPRDRWPELLARYRLILLAP